MRRILFLIILLVFTLAAFAQTDSLRAQIKNTVSTLRAEIGVAIKNFENGDTCTFDPHKRLPMQSVFKLPLVIYTLHLIDSGILQTHQKVRINTSDYFDTWSPIMKQYPNANVDLTIEELMMQTLTWSDNIGCDILFRLVGGPKSVNDYMHSIGINDISIVFNERDMHADWNNQFKNWCTPLAMMDILERVYKRDLLSKKSHDFVWKNMVDCPLGKMRLRGKLPEEVEIAHRTGTGGTNQQNIIGAVNDVGIIKLPNGEHIAVIVFISNSPEEQSKLEAVIATVARSAYDYYSTH